LTTSISLLLSFSVTKVQFDSVVCLREDPSGAACVLDVGLGLDLALDRFLSVARNQCQLFPGVGFAVMAMLVGAGRSRDLDARRRLGTGGASAVATDAIFFLFFGVVVGVVFVVTTLAQVALLLDDDDDDNDDSLRFCCWSR
jgi:hypothetical protein